MRVSRGICASLNSLNTENIFAEIGTDFTCDTRSSCYGVKMILQDCKCVGLEKLRDKSFIVKSPKSSFVYQLIPVDRGRTVSRGGHRLNMELDLQSLFGFHVHSCTHLLTLRNPTPLPPHLGSYTRALLVNQERRHLYVTHWWVMGVLCAHQNVSISTGYPKNWKNKDDIIRSSHLLFVCVGKWR